jgi:hypothetical protein
LFHFIPREQKIIGKFKHRKTLSAQFFCFSVLGGLNTGPHACWETLYHLSHFTSPLLNFYLLIIIIIIIIINFCIVILGGTLWHVQKFL